MVLHDWADAEALQILRNVAVAGGSGARLSMIEFVLPTGDTPHMAKMIDLTMLGMLTGKERVELEWRRLLESAGFDQIEVIPTQSALSVVQAAVK